MLGNLIKALKCFLGERESQATDTQETSDDRDVTEYPNGFVVSQEFTQGSYTLQAFGSSKYLSLWRLERSQYDGELVLRLVPFEWAIVRELLYHAYPIVGRKIKKVFSRYFYSLLSRNNELGNYWEVREVVRNWWQWLIT